MMRNIVYLVFFVFSFVSFFMKFAFADSGTLASDQKTSTIVSFIPLIVIFIIFYFIIIRPQQKKVRDHKDMLDSIKPKQRVITSAGIKGRIISIHENSFDIEISKDVVIEVLKEHVISILDLDLKRNLLKKNGNKKKVG